MPKAIGIQIPSPIQTVTQYAALTAQSESAVRMQITRGILPVVYLTEGSKAKPYINMLALFAKAANEAALQLNLSTKV